VYLSVNAVRSLAIAMFSFMPESAQKIWNQLGIDGNIQDIPWNAQSELKILSGHKLGDSSPLFARIETSDVEKYKKELGLSK
jgi:methionyl-tRNA synthetase